ncbi:MAG: tetratricopeptide repeat protein [Lachnospiraceae bacterium]|nr:tetratricopeptide repeat protein [Lachnospiraceae bacterium]
MKREILSLKNIYKFLTSNDYPVYSEGIIKKNNRIGLTLTRFCHENILVDFKNHKCGRIIWRTEGGRNRYVSQICNRSSLLPMYREYAEEIIAAVNEETMLRQIQQFMSFFVERQYRYNEFVKKLPALLSLFQDEDDGFTEEAAAFFDDAIKTKEKVELHGTKEEAFVAGWFLTFLMFHALMGNGEAEDLLCRLRADSRYSLYEMLNKYKQDNAVENRKVFFLTGNNTELSCPPLKTGHFFGRESELFELRERLHRKGAYLISGMGGSGKTELLRQFLKICKVENLVDYICVIQYEGGLAKSFVNAFSQIYGTDIKENYQEALARIRRYADKNVLIVIDNVDSEVEETELEALCNLSATIFVTSRFQKMQGLETYHLKPISRTAGSLIFRDNYGSYLNEEDKKTLDGILSKELWCHTLSLRLLAKTAKNNKWTLSRLRDELDMGNVPEGNTQEDYYTGLKNVYTRMYSVSKLSKEKNRLLRLIAALPYQNYDLSFMNTYLIKNWSENINEMLEVLWTKGWLDKSDRGYSMHPFISECILSSSLTEQVISPLLDNILQEWQKLVKSIDAELIPEIMYNVEKFMDVNKELLDVTIMLRSVLKKVTGKLNEKYHMLYLLAVTLECSIYGACDKEYLKILQTKADSLSEPGRLGIEIMKTTMSANDLEDAFQIFTDIKNDDSISRNLKETFADALGIRLFYVGRVEEAERLYDFILEADTLPGLYMQACMMKGQAVMQKGDLAGYEEWLQKGLDKSRIHGMEHSRYAQLTTSTLCSLYIVTGKYKEAKVLLEDMERQSEGESYQQKVMRFANRGLLDLQQGKEGFGVKDLEESVRTARILHSGNPEGVITAHEMNLANAYGKNKQFEEAVELYRNILSVYEEMDGLDYNKQTLLNNIGVLYLEWEKPEEAMEYLLRAYDMAKDVDRDSQGETAYRLSQAYAALGESEKEQECLQEALPIIEKMYGEEHPKVVDAKQRILVNS